MLPLTSRPCRRTGRIMYGPPLKQSGWEVSCFRGHQLIRSPVQSSSPTQRRASSRPKCQDAMLNLVSVQVTHPPRQHLLNPEASTSSTYTLTRRSAFPAISNIFSAASTVGALANAPSSNLTRPLFLGRGLCHARASLVENVPLATLLFPLGNAIQHIAAPSSRVSPHPSRRPTNPLSRTEVACAQTRKLRSSPCAMSIRFSQHTTCGGASKRCGKRIFFAFCCGAGPEGALRRVLSLVVVVLVPCCGPEEPDESVSGLALRRMSRVSNCCAV